MSKQTLIVIARVLACILLLSGVVLAMESDNYQLDWFTPLTSNGGGPASSDNYAINFTIGQSVAGTSDSASYAGCLGYWCGTAPTEVDVAPTVVSITRADPSPTTAASVDYTVTFSEDVTGLDTADFDLTTTGSITGASVTGVSGAGVAYTVAVSTGTGSGTLRLDIPATATVTDLTGNPLSGLPYTSGEVYTVVIRVYLPMVFRNVP